MFALLARFFLAAIVSLACLALWKLLQSVHHQFTSPLRHLRGPKPASLIYGSIEDMRCPRPGLFEEWTSKYGNTMRYKGFFYRDQLLTVDTRAVNHILARNYDYQKHPILSNSLTRIFGEGLLVAEGARHRQQRRVMNPAFGPGQIRDLTDIFFERADRLRSAWLSEIAEDSSTAATGARIDALPWMSRITLDAIGLAGFNYDFEALHTDGKPNELNEAFRVMSSAIQRLSILPVLKTWIPPLRLIPAERTRKVDAARRTMVRIGEDLLTNAKVAAQESATEKGEIEKHSLQGRDLLSLLVKANMATDIPENQRLSDEDVLAQVPTFILAGHETTSTALTWALFAMTQTPEVQAKLREELLSVNTSTPSMDDLIALPYLDIFVRETLRMYPPVPSTGRIAMKDDVIPLEKPFSDKHGVVHDTIRVSKGDAITVSFVAMNHSKELWGPDAHEFKPERWTKIPETASQVSGVWAHLLTFGGGPKGCIGYRFSLVEIKAVLFTLVRTFEFALAVPPSDIGKKTAIVQRPVLLSDSTDKPQLPLLVRPYQKG